MVEQVAVTIPGAVEEELTLLRGFKDLVAERTAYALGSKVLGREMSDATKGERKAVNEARKTLKTNIENFIRKADIDGYTEIVEQIKGLSAKLKEVRKPYMAKINPLRKAVKYMDNIAIPDSLKELGVTVQPSFSLSDWVKKAVESQKRR